MRGKMKKMINIGIIGVGHFGINYLKTFNQLDNAVVRWICAANNTTQNRVSHQLNLPSSIKTTTNDKDILGDKKVDAVAIVTPGSTHYKLAKEALMSNKHVIVEKPLAFSSYQVKELIKISNKKRKKLMVGHLHRFNPCFNKLKEDIKRGIFGRINYIHSVHAGNGPVRSDMNAMWDFFPHTVSILLNLLEELPIEVSSNGKCFLNKDIEDVVTIDMVFPNKVFSTTMVSWLYPIKKMDMTIIGENLYATFDDYGKNGKLKYYKNKPPLAEKDTTMKKSGYYFPRFKDGKPLTRQLQHFLDCINFNKEPITNGVEGLKVVSVLEAVQKSLRSNGARIKVKIP